jgi:hypothetical protein
LWELPFQALITGLLEDCAVACSPLTALREMIQLHKKGLIIRFVSHAAGVGNPTLGKQTVERVHSVLIDGD